MTGQKSWGLRIKKQNEILKGHMRNKGITLMEMIVVLAIISITAAMAVPNFQKSVEKKRADSAIATLRKISHCMRLYKLEHGGALPAGATFAVLDTNTSTGNGCLDRTQFAPAYTFPLATATMNDAAGVSGNDTKSTRMVCLVPAGSLARNGIVYDFPTFGAGCNTARTDKYRSFPE